MYKIFINNIPLHFTTPDDRVEFRNRTLWIREPQDAEINELLNVTHTHKELFYEIFLVGKDPRILSERFASACKLIEAAGGLVHNMEGKILLMMRHGKWDLPKGKVEHGEKIRDAALREVEEECGVKHLRVVKELAPTYHTYVQDDKYILKKTHWFEMESRIESLLMPQTEEGITEVKWMTKEEVKKAMENTYASIREILSR
ncbi:MAG TPA: NUDIX domain-containing protein [Bacteroidia bacterium]|jgi:ADP-ribose pyrophosphatase YjhB (NUDIX family)|nr:NUDIX domain-containing protein [Bacteroidia bacterium]